MPIPKMELCPQRWKILNSNTIFAFTEEKLFKGTVAKMPCHSEKLAEVFRITRLTGQKTPRTLKVQETKFAWKRNPA